PGDGRARGAQRVRRRPTWLSCTGGALTLRWRDDRARPTQRPRMAMAAVVAGAGGGAGGARMAGPAPGRGGGPAADRARPPRPPAAGFASRRRRELEP